MARPAKSAVTQTGHITKGERQARQQVENTIKGAADKLKPPTYLTAAQKRVFRYIVTQLDESKMLGNLDLFILSRAAVSICQIQDLDKQANADPDILFSNNYIRARKEAAKDFFRCCNELCLSPQARAKLSISAVKTPEKKSLLDLINEADDE